MNLTKRLSIFFIPAWFATASCADQQQVDRTKWPFPDAGKCAEYYQGLAQLSGSVASIAKQQMQLENAPAKKDSLQNIIESMRREETKYRDSAAYFAKIK